MTKEKKRERETPLCAAAPFRVDGKGTHIPMDMKNTPNQKKKKVGRRTRRGGGSVARHIMRPGRTHPKAATGREDGKGPTSFHTHHPIWVHQRAFRNPRADKGKERNR